MSLRFCIAVFARANINNKNDKPRNSFSAMPRSSPAPWSLWNQQTAKRERKYKRRFNGGTQTRFVRSGAKNTDWVNIFRVNRPTLGAKLEKIDLGCSHLHPSRTNSVNAKCRAKTPKGCLLAVVWGRSTTDSAFPQHLLRRASFYPRCSCYSSASCCRWRRRRRCCCCCCWWWWHLWWRPRALPSHRPCGKSRFLRSICLRFARRSPL